MATPALGTILGRGTLGHVNVNIVLVVVVCGDAEHLRPAAYNGTGSLY